ncbi:MAG: hypothetical protein MK082_02255 [Phycisphaerales bacterium]|nr:hypothetical protein [Phycisphaerales bacterium]
MPFPLHILLTSAAVQASPAPPEPPQVDRPSEDLRVEITPTAWFPRLIGTYAIGPEGTELNVETDTYLHESELAFQGELDYRFDAWSLRILGTEFSTSGSGILEASARVAGTDVAAGSDWSSTYSQWSIGAEVGLALWQPFADRPFPWSAPTERVDNSGPEADYLVEFRIGPRLGFRYLHVDQVFQSTAADVDYRFDGGVAALVLGVVVETEVDTRPIVPFLDSIAIEAGFTVSPLLAGGSGNLSSIEASLRAYLTPSASLVFGFRLQRTSFTSEEYEREGAVMGVITGCSFRF